MTLVLHLRASRSSAKWCCAMGLGGAAQAPRGT